MRVDILQVLSGIEFAESWQDRCYGTVNESFEVPVISWDKLVRNKLASGRTRDIADVEEMERARRLLEGFKKANED